MFDARKVSKICLCCTSPFHITDLVMCSAYSFPALYFVYLAVMFNWVLCLIPNLKFSCFSAFHGNELGSILLRHRIKNIRIQGPYYSRFIAYSNIFTLESGFKKVRIQRIRVDGSRTRKEKVSDSKISRYVWTEPKYSTSRFMEDVNKR